jgi:uncharacterized protein (UPF0332 family)
VAYPEDLLEIALHLARRDRKRPKQANLRRAVSTAYYALFHLLVSEAVGYWKLKRQRSVFARGFEHRKMKGICKNCNSPNADLQSVAEAFVELQQYRHLADYDNSRIWTRVSVLSLINTASEVFKQWGRVKDQAIAQDFLLALFIPDRR